MDSTNYDGIDIQYDLDYLYHSKSITQTKFYSK